MWRQTGFRRGSGRAVTNEHRVRRRATRAANGWDSPPGRRPEWGQPQSEGRRRGGGPIPGPGALDGRTLCLQAVGCLTAGWSVLSPGNFPRWHCGRGQRCEGQRAPPRSPSWTGFLGSPTIEGATRLPGRPDRTPRPGTPATAPAGPDRSDAGRSWPWHRQRACGRSCTAASRAGSSPAGRSRSR